MAKFLASITAPTPQPASPLDALRRRSVTALVAISWVMLLLLAVTDAWHGGGSVLTVLALGIVALAAPTSMALRNRHDAQTRMLIGSLAAIMPALLVFVLQGHAWQMDAHMYFFVGMAALIMLGDWKPIALAAALTAVHHIVLEWLAPAWVFTGSGNIGRLVFHASAVAIQFALLAYVTIRLERLVTAQEDALRESHELARIAEDERRRTQAAMDIAEQAQARAAEERSRRMDIEQRARAERRGELVTLAKEFEHGVSGVVKAIGEASAQLESSAIQLDDVAGSAGRESGEVAVGVSQTAGEIAHVASSIRVLSRSITTIASAAKEQSGLTDAATASANRSVQTVAMLEERAAQIEVFVEDIRKIASQTNLLALNASIEAARAGDAGRGFAVVATEVKSLSADTARASDQIIALLSAMREGVMDTGVKLRDVDSVIRDVERAAAGIAAAVHDQRGASEEIDEGAMRAAASADAIEHRIGRVAGAVGTAAALSSQVRESARDLASTARTLRSSTDMFVSFLHADMAA